MTERIELKNFSSKGEALLPSYSLPPQAKSPSETSSQNIKNDYLGMFFACIAVFCRAFGQCFTKLIQKTYPNDFRTVPFLFLRSFMIVTLSLPTSPKFEFYPPGKSHLKFGSSTEPI